jgi:hypothetical protein
MIAPVIDNILALADPHYLSSVSLAQLKRDLLDEVRFFRLFSDSEMKEVKRYVQGLVEKPLPSRMLGHTRPASRVSDDRGFCHPARRKTHVISTRASSHSKRVQTARK